MSMNREDIYKMVRESDLGFLLGDNWMMHHEFEYFAALVASAAVRETSAEYRLGWNDGQIAEREACAKVCESLPLEWPDQPTFAQTERATMMDCAAAIRARGQA